MFFLRSSVTVIPAQIISTFPEATAIGSASKFMFSTTSSLFRRLAIPAAISMSMPI